MKRQSVSVPWAFFLYLGVGVAVAMAVAGPSRAADAWPEKTVRIVVPLGAGGANDTVARLLAQHLSESFGRPFVVDNRAGGATNIGTELVARSVPDGYTLLVTNSSSVANVTLYPNLPFDFRIGRKWPRCHASGSASYTLRINRARPALGTRGLMLNFRHNSRRSPRRVRGFNAG